MTGSPASVHVLALAGYLVLLGFLTALGPVRAQPADGPVLQFDIAAQNLGDALDLYSRRTGIAVLMDQRYTQRQSAAVRGAYAAGAALQALLRALGCNRACPMRKPSSCMPRPVSSQLLPTCRRPPSWPPPTFPAPGRAAATMRPM